jgi:hypothetical protein
MRATRSSPVSDAFGGFCGRGLRSGLVLSGVVLSLSGRGSSAVTSVETASSTSMTTTNRRAATPVA